MSDEQKDKGLGRPETGGEYREMMSIPDIAKMFGITPAAVRLWKITPAVIVPFGDGRKLRLYWKDDVIAYATSRRRLNRLPKTGRKKE